MTYNLVNWNKTEVTVIDGEFDYTPTVVLRNVGRNCLTYETALEAALAYLGYEVVAEED